MLPIVMSPKSEPSKWDFEVRESCSDHGVGPESPTLDLSATRGAYGTTLVHFSLFEVDQIQFP